MQGTHDNQSAFLYLIVHSAYWLINQLLCSTYSSTKVLSLLVLLRKYLLYITTNKAYSTLLSKKVKMKIFIFKEKKNAIFLTKRNQTVETLKGKFSRKIL